MNIVLDITDFEILGEYYYVSDSDPKRSTCGYHPFNPNTIEVDTDVAVALKRDEQMPCLSMVKKFMAIEKEYGVTPIQCKFIVENPATGSKWRYNPSPEVVW